MKRILVPTDFSATAERALLVALDIAAKINASVILHHAYTAVKNEFVSTAANRELYNKQTEINLVKKLQRLRKKVSPGSDVPVSTIVGRTPVVDNILGFAEANRVDMIIMGTQGASGLRKTIIGSVASKVVENADIPVLLIPQKFTLKDPGHILFATNYEHADKEALSVLLSIAKPYNSTVTVLHLLNAYLMGGEKEREKDHFDAYSYSLQREFNNVKLKFKLLESTSITETMENLDKIIPYDMIAMVRRKKGFYEKFFLGSFTKNMAYVTKLPLLVVPQGEAEMDEDKIATKEEYTALKQHNLQVEKIFRTKSNR